jgi:RNA polymerase sigma factor (sigma-70 family)
VAESSDPELIARLQCGDPAAFDEVYATWRARMHGFLLRLTGRRDLAEDLLQETWLRLARHAHRLRDDTRLGPWLFTVARNLHTSHRRWSLAELLRSEHGAAPDMPASPFEETAAAQLERRLEEALADLPLAYREVLLLVAVEKLAHDDAAAVLGLSPVALRKRLSRARGLLQAELDDSTPRARARRKAMR